MIVVRYTEKNGTIGFIETSRFTFRENSEIAKDYKRIGFEDVSNLYSKSEGYRIEFPNEGLVIDVKSFDVAINGTIQDESFNRGIK